VKDILKKIINTCLSPAGLVLRRIDADGRHVQVQEDLLRQLLAAFRELGFSHLPDNSRRIFLMMRLMGANASHAVYLVEYLQRSLALPGDVCEFGVAAGATSALLANEMADTDKKLWLFDSFKGLSKPSAEDKLLDDILALGSMEEYEGAMNFPVESVRARLREIDFPEQRTVIVPGYVEDTLKGETVPKKVCFAYVDMDLYNPIRLALDFLDNRICPGGHVVVHDYGFLSEGVKVAVDKFLDSRKGIYTAVFPHEFAGAFVVLQKHGE
jgi:O-methyltransferase